MLGTATGLSGAKFVLDREKFEADLESHNK
jgi:hypothetical protein